MAELLWLGCCGWDVVAELLWLGCCGWDVVAGIRRVWLG